MLKRSITYQDFDGQTQTEDFYFNLSKAELVEMEVSTSEGLGESLKRIIDQKDHYNLIKEFKQIILSAYGQKSPDGKRFVKSAEMREAFMQTAAFDALFMELVTNSDAAFTFIKGVVPADLSTEPQAPIQLPPPVVARDLATGAPIVPQG